MSIRSASAGPPQILFLGDMHRQGDMDRSLSTDADRKVLLEQKQLMLGVTWNPVVNTIQSLEVVDGITWLDVVLTCFNKI